MATPSDGLLFQRLPESGHALDEIGQILAHLKAIGHTSEAQPLLDKAGVESDAGVINLAGRAKAFVGPASTRQWDREPNVRILA